MLVLVICNSTILVSFPRDVGRVPVSGFEPKLRTCSVVILPIWVGMEPTSEFEDRIRLSNGSAPRDVGMVPVSELEPRSSICRVVMVPIAVGMLPVSFRLSRLTETSCPLVLQLNPCHPHGSVVGKPFTHCQDPVVDVTVDISVDSDRAQRPALTANVGFMVGAGEGSAVGGNVGK